MLFHQQNKVDAAGSILHQKNLAFSHHWIGVSSPPSEKKRLIRCYTVLREV